MTRIVSAIAILLLVVISASAEQRAIRRHRAAGAGGNVNLPYQIPDGAGTNWTIYGNGLVRQNGNMPMFAQAALLMINGEQAPGHNNRGRIDPKSQELVIEGLTVGQVQLTRRVKAMGDGTIRIVDVLEADAEQVDLTLQSSVNFGINLTESIEDPGTGNTLGVVAQTGAGQMALAVYALVGAKLEPMVIPQPEMNTISSTISVPLSKARQAAIVHIHGSVATTQAARDLVLKMDVRKYLSDLPPEVQKILVNVPSQSGLVGDVELPRDAAQDVIEIRTGDRLTGTIDAPSYLLQTPFGALDVKADRVLGMVSIGQYKPRQILVLNDGQLIGGHIEAEHVPLTMSSGQVVRVPMGRIVRMGYRYKGTEPESPTLAAPWVQLRSGDRIGLRSGGAAVPLVTRLGPLSLERDKLAAIVPGDPNAPVPTIELTDGSKLQAMVAAQDLQVILRERDGPVTLPVASVTRLQLAEPTELDPQATPVLTMISGDRLVGSLSGVVRLQLAFDEVTLNAEELRGINRHSEAGGNDVQVTTWDGAKLSGQFVESQLSLKTQSGIDLKAPVALLDAYAQPAPAPSGQMLERIRSIVAELDAADWKRRDAAEAQLAALGPSVVGVLKQRRASQPAEVQQRIDSILRRLDAEQPAPNGPGISVPGGELVD